ncbi:MAG: cobalt ECF transporter T component CbiQ [Halobacteriota archaeon]|nr:cobalt ECF transporter T component CbiQ [Halobacteriota archaeon]
MNSNFIERYTGLDSIIHKLDPRIKVILLFTFIIFVVLTPPPDLTEILIQPSEVLIDASKFLFYFMMIFFLILLSKLPFNFVFKRSIIILPFILFAFFVPFVRPGTIAASYSLGSLNLNVSYEGLSILFNIISKSWISVLSMITLVSTTKFPTLLKAIERLKVPKLIVIIISFMYRYILLLVDEVMMMRRARDCRSFGGDRRWHMRTIGTIIGTLFIRSYERGERIYAAMVSRGFSGDVRILDDFKITKVDIFISTIFLLYTCVIFFG